MWSAALSEGGGAYRERRRPAGGYRVRRQRARWAHTPLEPKYIDKVASAGREPLGELDRFERPPSDQKVVNHETALDVFETWEHLDVMPWLVSRALDAVAEMAYRERWDGRYLAELPLRHIDETDDAQPRRDLTFSEELNSMLTAHPNAMRCLATARHTGAQCQRATRARKRKIDETSGKNRWDYERNGIDEDDFEQYWPANWDGWPMWRVGTMNDYEVAMSKDWNKVLES